MTDKALVIIDLQNDYFPGGKWPLHKIEAATGNAISVLEAARAAGDLIIHVHHEFDMKGAPFFEAGTKGADIHASIQPLPSEKTILKNQVNAFRDTDLKSVLDQHGIKHITLVGAMSHMCIDAAARAAADFGYAVTVVEDACASRDLEFGTTTIKADDVHAAYMSALSFAYAAIVKTSDHIASQ